MNYIPNKPDPYIEFLKAKVAMAAESGLIVDPAEVNPLLKPHQRDIVLWAIRGGRRGIFAAFGLGKTIIQCEIVRLVLLRTGGNALVVLPLGVRQEFMRDAAMLGMSFSFIRRAEEMTENQHFYLTNYESVRDGKLDPRLFTVISLDEAACLRGFGGTKTFREFMRLFEGTDTYRFVATATPSPNDYIELLAYAAFLDVIVPGGLTGLGFQTVYPFSDDCIRHFTKHGFAFLARKSIITDVVRENNQTYRLGWTEQCKDGSRMGCGMPEYLLLFRKPPTDNSNGYADEPVVKEKENYTRSRWQIDAHGFMRSSGNRLLRPEELETLSHEAIFRLFRQHSLSDIYDFEHHVKIGESLEERGQLPVTFMLLQPQSWHTDVWTDITRMLTLNGAQSAKGKELHLCPMQFDIADRVINQFSQEGEIVFDPFSGLGTVPFRAIKLRRKGIGVELNPRYFYDACSYCRTAELEMSSPSLFDFEEAEDTSLVAA